MRIGLTDEDKHTLYEISIRMLLLEKIDTALRITCTGKNIIEFYDGRRHFAESKVEIIKKYISGLGLDT